MPTLISGAETKTHLNPVSIYFLSLWMVTNDKHALSEAFWIQKPNVGFLYPGAVLTVDTDLK